MGTFRNVNSDFWKDPKVEDDFTPEDKYFFLYLLTNRHTNISGCYEISKRQMSKEMGYSVETIDNLIYRFKNIHKIIDYDADTCEVFVLNWHKYNWSKSEKLVRAVEKCIEEIENEHFRHHLYALLKCHVNGDKKYPIYTLSNDISDTGCQYPIGYSMDTRNLLHSNIVTSKNVSSNVVTNNAVSDDSVSDDCEEEDFAAERHEPEESNTEKKKKVTAKDMLLAKGFSPELERAVYEWIVYKNEKRQSYKPTGLQSLLTQTENNANEFGDKAVIDVIRLSMSQNWMGISWNQIGSNQSKQYGTGRSVPPGKSGGGEYTVTQQAIEDSV